MTEDPTGGDRDELARWYADRHFLVDPAVRRILYLPSGAPETEIRLLEVNDAIVELEPLEAMDFRVDIRGCENHRLYVLDVTPSQWDAVQNQTLSLPEGWSLEGAREMPQTAAR